MMRRIQAIAVVGFALLGAGNSHAQDTTIRSFEVHISEDALADLRHRIQATRWPETETVADASPGVDRIGLPDNAGLRRRSS